MRIYSFLNWSELWHCKAFFICCSLKKLHSNVNQNGVKCSHWKEKRLIWKPHFKLFVWTHRLQNLSEKMLEGSSCWERIESVSQLVCLSVFTRLTPSSCYCTVVVGLCVLRSVVSVWFVIQERLSSAVLLWAPRPSAVCWGDPRCYNRCVRSSSSSLNIISVPPSALHIWDQTQSCNLNFT